MKKITASYLSQETGVAYSYASMILNGQRRPSPGVAARLEKASGWNRLFWLYPNEYDKQGNRLADESLPGQ